MSCVRGVEQHPRREVRDHERDATVRERDDCSPYVIGILQPDLFKNELLIQELARRIVVLHRKLRTREAAIVRQHVEQRYRGLPLGDVKIADLDHDRLGRPRERCKRKKHRGYREKPDQRATPNLS